jgi:SAM-dependent methyltransferase
MTGYSEQIDSAGGSSDEILEGALAAAQPQRGLSWLDIGCGRGDLLRRVRDRWAPARLAGIDAIGWLADDLAGDVDFRPVSIEDADGLQPADRVMLVEVIEHLQAPWTALRQAARLVASGGRLVITTPNIATLRHRLELAVRGNLTSFRPDFAPHLSPALPHVTTRILEEEGLSVDPPRYAGADVVSLTGGRQWPEAVRRRWPRLTSISVVVAATAPTPPPPAQPDMPDMPDIPDMPDAGE